MLAPGGKEIARMPCCESFFLSKALYANQIQTRPEIAENSNPRNERERGRRSPKKSKNGVMKKINKGEAESAGKRGWRKLRFPRPWDVEALFLFTKALTCTHQAKNIHKSRAERVFLTAIVPPPARLLGTGYARDREN